MTDLSLGQFLNLMPKMIVETQRATNRALNASAKVVEQEAKDSIGTYQSQSGPFVAWKDLADSTLADKERKGFAPPDNPELRSGEMRDSIKHTVHLHVGGGTAYVGSDDKILEFQELGTSKMPPRSILGGALVRKEDRVVEIMGRYVFGALIGAAVTEQSLVIKD